MNWHKLDPLEIVEQCAEWQNIGNSLRVIASEEDLSELFDEMNTDWLKDHENDQCAIDQCFNDFTDFLCKNGEIHPEQYNNYCYVGKYSE